MVVDVPVLPLADGDPGVGVAVGVGLESGFAPGVTGALQEHNAATVKIAALIKLTLIFLLIIDYLRGVVPVVVINGSYWINKTR